MLKRLRRLWSDMLLVSAVRSCRCRKLLLKLNWRFVCSHEWFFYLLHMSVIQPLVPWRCWLDVWMGMWHFMKWKHSNVLTCKCTLGLTAGFQVNHIAHLIHFCHLFQIRIFGNFVDKFYRSFIRQVSSLSYNWRKQHNTLRRFVGNCWMPFGGKGLTHVGTRNYVLDGVQISIERTYFRRAFRHAVMS